MTDTQILWGDTKLIAIDKTPQYKIDKAKCIIDQALSGKLGFAWGLFKRDAFEFDEKSFKKCKSNYVKVKNALALLSREGYIEHYLFRSNGEINVSWFKKYSKPEAVKHVDRLHQKHDLSVLTKPCPRTVKQVKEAERSDRTAVKKPWCDGRPEYTGHQNGISAEDYEYNRKFCNKIASLPLNYVENRGD